MTDNSNLITKDTIKRLLQDVKEIIKNPLEDNNIFYKHDEENILKGYAYICGPPDSVYFGGNYFFTFTFPYDYPHSPPKVDFETSDKITRFHPNLYRNKKVCLSILNTWRGDSWSGCQSIRTVLLILVTLLDNKPLLHEPGITETHRDFESYNHIISYKNIEFAVLELMKKESPWVSEPFLTIFKDNMIQLFNKNKNKISQIIDDNINKFGKKDIKIYSGIYTMNIIANWSNLKNTLSTINIH